MWFKNLLVYRFTQPFTRSTEEMEELLSRKPFTGCGSQDMLRLGWTAPLDQKDAPLVHAGNGCLMLCLKRQEKVLPAAVVNEFLQDRIDEIKEQEDRNVGRKERAELKDQIIFELLPRAFTRNRKVFAYIDTVQQLLIINSGSAKQAEELIVTLRETIESLPVVPLKPQADISQTLTRWISESHCPPPFSMGGECELQDRSDTAAVLKCKNLDLQSQEIKSHVESGMMARKLELIWDGGIEFVLDENLAIKRLRFDDLITDKLSETHIESAADQFDADFALMTSEFQNFIPALMEAFGGLGDAS